MVVLLPEQWQHRIELLIHGLVGTFGALMVYGAGIWAVAKWGEKKPMLPLPDGIDYLPAATSIAAGLPIAVVFQKMVGGMQVFSFLAIPFFVFGGELMLYGGMAGSPLADVSAIGSVMIPLMKKEGYDADYAVNVTTHAALAGALLPTSHNLIIFTLATAGIASVSALSMMLAGIVPALIPALCNLGAA